MTRRLKLHHPTRYEATPAEQQAACLFECGRTPRPGAGVCDQCAQAGYALRRGKAVPPAVPSDQPSTVTQPEPERPVAAAFDPICGCPVVYLASNRRDRRSAARRSQVPAGKVTKHRRGCPRAGQASRSDPERGRK